MFCGHDFACQRCLRYSPITPSPTPNPKPTPLAWQSALGRIELTLQRMREDPAARRALRKSLAQRGALPGMELDETRARIVAKN